MDLLFHGRFSKAKPRQVEPDLGGSTCEISQRLKLFAPGNTGEYRICFGQIRRPDLDNFTVLHLHDDRCRYFGLASIVKGDWAGIG